MLRIFVTYIGGSTKNSNIELHDIRFVLAERIEDTYETLRKEWWGTPSSLHLDCWMELTRADGYSIELKPTPPTDNSNKLYFVNLGGYDHAEFAEVHKNVFVVAENESKAKVKALKQALHWRAFHKDEMMDVEQTVCLSKQAKENSLYIHLTKIDDTSMPEFVCKYISHAKLKAHLTK